MGSSVGKQLGYFLKRELCLKWKNSMCGTFQDLLKSLEGAWKVLMRNKRGKQQKEELQSEMYGSTVRMAGGL